MSARPVPPRPGPGQGAARLAQMLRVDHAGELGAVHIYRGQRAVMAGAAGRAPIEAELAQMEAHEARHLARFDELLTQNGVRPTLLAPVWRIAGFTLGAATALIGERAVHICTEAVETVIEAHYGAQIEEIGETSPGLAGELAQFRGEELAHRDQARAGGAESGAPGRLLAGAIRLGCRAAIKLSERL
jgi:ubiquinone biosynthesis monooxygenase Coq7